MTYTIVEFHDGIQLVPNNWISHDKSSCYWPPSSYKQKKIDYVIEFKLEPNTETWTTYSVLRIVGSSDNYESGMCKVKQAQQYSDVATSSKFDTKNRSTQKQYKHKNTKIVDVSNKKLPSEIIYHPSALHSTPLRSYKNRKPVKKKLCNNPHHNIWQKRVLKHLFKIRIELKSLKEQNKEYKTMLEKFLKNPNNSINDDFTDVDLNELNIGFPFSEEIKLLDIESKLMSDQAFYSKMVMTLKVFGGTDLTDIVNTVLSKLMDNYLAVKYSFAGRQKKKSFKETFPTLLKAIISVARFHRPKSTHKEIHYQIGRWLVQGQLRKTRQEKKAIDQSSLPI